MLILLDQDGVLADFEGGFIQAWQQHYPDLAPIAREDRRHFNLLDDYPADLHERTMALYTAPGFIGQLPPIDGAIEAVRELLALGLDIRFCTSPLHQYENCVAEKYHWIEHHFGRPATQRLILTRDKTLVRGDLLIDDKPRIEGLVTPSWRHIVFDAPYNREVTDTPRMTWANWRDTLAGALYLGDQ